MQMTVTFDLTRFTPVLIDLQLPPSCEVEFTVPEHCSTVMHNLLTSTANYQAGDAVRLLAMFSCAVLKQQSDTIKLKLSGLIVTGSALVILEDNAHWLMPDSDRMPLVVREQAMSNLIAIVSIQIVSVASSNYNLRFVTRDDFINENASCKNAMFLHRESLLIATTNYSVIERLLTY